MQPRTITFCGQEVTVPFIGGRRLTRLCAALKALSKTLTVKTTAGEMPLGEALQGVTLQEYPDVMMTAFQLVLDQTVENEILTEPERLIYGSLGSMIGQTADEVADAPLDDLSALCTAIYEQERDTQAGKRMIRTFLGYGDPTTTNAPSADDSASNTATTTPAKSGKTLATTGAA
jgi:hypothetical protein